MRFVLVPRWVKVILLLLMTGVFVAGVACSVPILSGVGDGSPPVDASDPQDDQIAREIEEADIVKVVNGFMYIANPFTGLRIIDVQSMDQPRMGGAVQLSGRATELIVLGDYAIVITQADDFDCAGQAVGQDAEALTQLEALTNPDFDYSRLWLVDVSDIDNPTQMFQHNLDGNVIATRRVGDVIYVIGHASEGYIFDGDDMVPVERNVYIKAFNVADPAAIFLVDSEQFPSESGEAYVSQNAVYVLADDPDNADSTIVSYVDISDPAGTVGLRDQIRVPGVIENRYFADEFNGTFRIITEELIQDSWTRVIALFTYDVSNPDQITYQARVPIISNEDLRSVRFDGNRAYAVTFEQIDPLFVLDLSDPDDPIVAGELEVPGYSTHLVPMGDRLIGVGFDNTSGVRPAVALYDVSDATNPRQLSRIMVGEEYTSDTMSEATIDEKALRVVSDAGVILLPFSVFDDDAGRYIDSLQIIGLETNKLTEHGIVEHRGLVRRADVLDQRLWVLSDQAFQSVNVADLDTPVSLRMLDLISEQDLTDLGLASCADTARSRGTAVGLWFNDGWGNMGPPTGFGPCGLLSLFALLALFSGLVATRHNARIRQ